MPGTARHTFKHEARTLGIVAASLLALLGVSLLTREVPSAVGNVAGLCIAAVKALLVALVFMRLRRETPLVRLFSAAGLFWLLLLMGLTLTDYLTRR